MIDIKELRIGNLVLVQSRKLATDISDVLAIDKVVPQSCTRYHPIPITPEWLERLGFEKYDFMQVPSYKEPYCIDIHNGNTISERELFVISHGMVQVQQIYEKDITSCVFPINVKYVHQLQNLYFALTGKELTIK